MILGQIQQLPQLAQQHVETELTMLMKNVRMEIQLTSMDVHQAAKLSLDGYVITQELLQIVLHLVETELL